MEYILTIVKNQNFIKGMKIREYLLGFTAYSRCMPIEDEPEYYSTEPIQTIKSIVVEKKLKYFNRH